MAGPDLLHQHVAKNEAHAVHIDYNVFSFSSNVTKATSARVRQQATTVSQFEENRESRGRHSGQGGEDRMEETRGFQKPELFGAAPDGSRFVPSSLSFHC